MSYLKLILIFIAFLNFSCSKTVQKNGVSSFKIKEIKIEPGITSRTNLINKYGPPIFESIFNKNTIYYVSQVSSYKNLSDRKTTDLTVLEIILDKENIVQIVNKYDENDAANIKISSKKTLDNKNTSLIFFKDIINNLRRRNVEN
jgi:outer membrane protein assembly factor BamE (lipoprotein component of BamABCDE complex)